MLYTKLKHQTVNVKCCFANWCTNYKLSKRPAFDIF